MQKPAVERRRVIINRPQKGNFMDEKYYLTKGSADSAENEEYIKLINLAFGFDGKERSFRKLLPKLFGEDKRSAPLTWFVRERESGRALAAVLNYPLEFNICGEKVKAFGIGNVGVHPDFRGRDFMKETMAAAHNEMISAGADFSALSGRRQRYNHFGYEKCGTDSVFTLTRKTVSYIVPDFSCRLEMKKLEREDAVTLDAIYALQNGRVYRTERPRAQLYDVMISWEATPYVFFIDGALVGWAIDHHGTVTELVAVDPAYYDDMIIALSSLYFETRYLVPDFERGLARALWKYTETVYTGADLCFSIFNYEKMIGLLMKLRSTCSPLADGRLAVGIDGVNCAENLLITVKDGAPFVTRTDASPEITLGHLEAMRFFFCEKCVEREKLNPDLASWFPLPIYIFSADNV